jgi:hypothetical protein
MIKIESAELYVTASVHAYDIGSVQELTLKDRGAPRCFTVDLPCSLSWAAQKLFDDGSFACSRAEINWKDVTATMFLSGEQVADLRRKLDLLCVTNVAPREAPTESGTESVVAEMKAE